MSVEPLLEVIDDLVPVELFHEACKISNAKGWYFGHGSHDGDTARFWKMDLEGVAAFDSIWEHARERCGQLAGAPLRVLRQYANGHTYGLGGQPHLDDHRPGSFTLLYYPMQEWKEGWEGETVFYDAHGEIALAVKPRPNRGILFDSRIPHAGRAPSRSYMGLRVTVAYKLSAIGGSAEALPATARDEDKKAEEGPERKFTVRVPADEVRRLVQEQLQRAGESVRLPGFRPGKIPMHVLERRYGANSRAEVLKRLAADAAATVEPGNLVSAVDVSQVTDGGAEFRLTVVNLPALPDPDVAQFVLDRLTASDSELQSAGVGPEVLQDFVKQQMLDHLEQSYSFELPGAAVDREYAAILEAAGVGPQVTEEEAAELPQIAQRRVRVGIVVAELARRYKITGPQMEGLVIERLISQAQVRERRATIDELRELG